MTLAAILIAFAVGVVTGWLTSVDRKRMDWLDANASSFIPITRESVDFAIATDGMTPEQIKAFSLSRTGVTRLAMNDSARAQGGQDE